MRTQWTRILFAMSALTLALTATEAHAGKTPRRTHIRRKRAKAKTPVKPIAPKPISPMDANADMTGGEPPQIRLRFENAEISEILHALSLKSGSNIVLASSNLRRTLSMNIAVYRVDDALKTITASAGLGYRLINGTYIVGNLAELKQALEASGEQTRVPLKSLSPEIATKILEAATPLLTVRAAGAQLLLIGSKEDIEQALAILKDEDKTERKEEPATEVLSLTHLTPSEVAAFIKTTYPRVKAQAVGMGDKAGGSLSLTGIKQALEEVKSAITRIDKPIDTKSGPPAFRLYRVKYSQSPQLQEFLSKAFPKLQVLLGPEAYAPSNPSFRPIAAGNLGNNAGGNAGGGGAGQNANNGSSGSVLPGGTAEGDNKRRDRANLLIISGAASEVDAAMKLLDQIDIAPMQVMVEVRVVDTSPESASEIGLKWDWRPFGFLEQLPNTPIDPATQRPLTAGTVPVGGGVFSRLPTDISATLGLMVSRKEAKILADPRIQVVDNEDASFFIGDTVRTQVSQAGLAGTNIQVLEFPVGIILLVRPRIHGDGKVTLRVHPVVSTITGFGAGNLPQSSSREAETTVMLKDGETVVIGGLIREEQTRSLQEVPLLSRLPLVGELFRNRTTNKRKSDLLIFITPKVVKP